MKTYTDKALALAVYQIAEARMQAAGCEMPCSAEAFAVISAAAPDAADYPAMAALRNPDFLDAAYILLLGPMLEEKYGSVRLVAVMAVTALVTGLINNLLFGNVALCGASGIVFAFILLTSFTSFKEGEIPLTFILVAVIYLGQQIVDGITVRDNISNLSHILGGIVGGAAGYVLNRKH